MAQVKYRKKKLKEYDELLETAKRKKKKKNYTKDRDAKRAT